MTPDQFAWWLHGWTEIQGGAVPSAAQWQVIRDHLDLVFTKVTPNRTANGGTSPAAVGWTGMGYIFYDPMTTWMMPSGVAPTGVVTWDTDPLNPPGTPLHQIQLC